jgi:SARP family transcriptional regulator, regulator of embCAB operon
MEFSILGPLEVRHEGRLVPINGNMRQALLGILLLNAGHVTRMAALIDGMWPEGAPRSAVENIRTYVCQIRSVFETIGEQDRVRSHLGGYGLIVDAGELDLHVFEEVARSGRHALENGDAAAAVARLTQALALWSGQPLGGLEFGRLVSARLIALEEQRRQVLVDLIDARLARRDHATLVSTLRRLVAEHPFDEGLWSRLVIVLYALGRGADALEAYAEVRHNLTLELGVEPGPGLSRVQRAVLRGDDWESMSVLGCPALRPSAELMRTEC